MQPLVAAWRNRDMTKPRSHTGIWHSFEAAPFDKARVPTSLNLPGGHALPDFVTRIDRPGVLKRALVNLRIHAIDHGWTRRVPLRTHVVVCGFPRAGTTLLTLMLQVAYGRAKAFPKERAALRVAYRTDRDHPLMLSKRPDDIFYLEQLRAVYRYRSSNVRFLLMMRDPRAVLTSEHASAPGRYYVSPARWRAIYDQVWANRAASDCLMVRFEDMVEDIATVQHAVARFIGLEPDVPFDRFLDSVPVGFRTTALNGLRGLDTAAIQKWRQPRHIARIAALLNECSELPKVLIDTGYEQDTTWMREYTGTDTYTPDQGRRRDA